MEFNEFRDEVSKLFSLNLVSYKEKQLKRRIEHLMNSQGYNQYKDYLKVIKVDENQRNRFLDKLTINVSEFFRNKEIFQKLEEEYLPELLKRNDRLRIWSAACSNGSEPYSVAIILDALTPGTQHKLIATDIDRKVLLYAREAQYKKELLKNVSDTRLEKYFTQVDERYQLKDYIINKVTFERHDILMDTYERNFDLIICRNVTIYFTRDTQNGLYENFYRSLRPGGILFIGATESILNYTQFGFEKLSPWFYQKPK